MNLPKPSSAVLVATLLLVASFMVGCRKGTSSNGPLHRERAVPQDASCVDPTRPRAFFYPASNRTDYGPDDPKQDGCTLLVSDHLFCCPDVKRATDR